ncbi:MAG: Asd/ArgC dimerization domain-containing protein [Cellvibrionales bacterium]|nr:Asd/ArgC dimerization domain-containing protein [Cellvibrionales bacterium]
MSKTLGILAKPGLLLDAYIQAFEQSVIKDSEIELLTASQDQGDTVMVKGRPKGFTFIESIDPNQLDLLLVLESHWVVDAYTEVLNRLDCQIIGLASMLKPLSPVLFDGGVNGEKVMGVQEPEVSAIASALAGRALEALDCKVLYSADWLGQMGIETLAKQTARLLNAQSIEEDIFPHQLPFNLYPLADAAGQDQMVVLTEAFSQGFDCDEISVDAVQLPVFHGQTLLVNAIFSESVDLDAFEPVWQAAGMHFQKNDRAYSQLRLSEIDENAIIARTKLHAFDENRLDFWLTFDRYQWLVNQSLMPLSEILLNPALS